MDEEELVDGNIDKPWHEGLTDKQRRFVEEYSLDWNATQAAIRAGYSEHTAMEQGSRLLSNVKVRAAVDIYLDVFSMTTGEALRRLTDMGRASIEPFIESYGRSFKLDLSSAQAQLNLHLIKEIGSTANGPYIKLHDAKDAIKILLEARGKIIKRHEHTGKDGEPIQNHVVNQWIIKDYTNGQPLPGIDE